MTNIILVVHVLAAIAIVVLVLLQQGRGADMGAAFGGGSQTLFGARGSANFLSRITGVLAAVFFITSLTLAVLYGRGTEQRSVTEQEVVEQPQAPVAESDIPAVPGAPEPAPAEQGEVPAVPDAPSPEPANAESENEQK